MTAFDRRLILILIIGAAFLFGMRFVPVSAKQVIARVEVDGKLIREIKLDQAEGRIIAVPFGRGLAQLEIQQGRVRMLEMPEEICPRKVCSHTGWIGRSGETIICVPNHLVVRLTASTTERFDAITR